MAPLIKLCRADVGEEEAAAVRDVLASGVLTNGEQNRAFEREFAARHDVAHGVTFANGTVALAAMLLAEGIGPGDEVVVPSLTFVSTATAVRHVGATPVFAEVDPRSFVLDPADVEARITPRTRAVLTVHYAGQPDGLDEMRGVCGEYGVLLLEDAAQAAGARWRGRPIGGFGRSAMVSFTPTKNITTGEGGMVLTDADDLAERLRLLRNHGQTRLYRHEVLGHNWRLTEMQAAMGRVQLGKLDAILARKKWVVDALDEVVRAVPGVTPPYRVPGADGVHMLYTCLLDEGIDRDAVLAGVLARDVEARVYFPPVHQQPIFASRAVRLPVTEALSARMLSLPAHSLLTADEVERIGAALASSVRAVAA